MLQGIHGLKLKFTSGLTARRSETNILFCSSFPPGHSGTIPFSLVTLLVAALLPE